MPCHQVGDLLGGQLGDPVAHAVQHLEPVRLAGVVRRSARRRPGPASASPVLHTCGVGTRNSGRVAGRSSGSARYQSSARADRARLHHARDEWSTASSGRPPGEQPPSGAIAAGEEPFEQERELEQRAMYHERRPWR